MSIDERAEYEANWFASSLLLPEAWFRDMWLRTGGNWADIAAAAKVPPDFARGRALGLGLIVDSARADRAP
jgi:Zn-dependent peptidase ImmA (M78 family)